MPAQRHTKESIIQTLQNLARQLGKTTLSKKDVTPVLPASSINYHFGSLGRALESARLERTGSADHLRDRGNVITDDDLFRSLAEVHSSIGREPGCLQYEANGEYSSKPFRDRFGRWDNVLAHYRKWRAENPDFCTTVAEPQALPAPSPAASASLAVSATPELRKGSRPVQLYGEPIDFRGLRHAPINEQGVVYLFGMVSRELGFNVEAIQQGFPDCEAKCQHDAKSNLWAKARIEFEFRSSSFEEHGHSPDQCDFVVCWEHDWPDCPVTVIELRKEILRLPSG
jgi:hypothetical protein